MIQFIIGEKGKGKTKVLLDKANSEVKEANGNFVYLDKNTQHMFELNNRVRLIDVSQYQLDNNEQFLGFISGILSQDHDLEQMYFDSFVKIAKLEGQDILPTIQKLEKISESFKIDFILSISLNESALPEEVKSKIIVSL